MRMTDGERADLEADLIALRSAVGNFSATDLTNPEVVDHPGPGCHDPVDLVTLLLQALAGEADDVLADVVTVCERLVEA